MALWADISAQISTATGQPFCIKRRDSIGGGCINAAYAIEDGAQRYFVKTNDAGKAGMFEAEAAGLKEIAQTGTVRVPQPICWGVCGEFSWLVLEHLELHDGDHRSMEQFGRQLAQLHQAGAAVFGWHIDNTIGATPQINTQCGNWIDFWREQRLGFQLRLAARNGYNGGLQRKGERLLADFPALFAGHVVSPALLHGDLWGGNHAADDQGNPVIFDPAMYYGDRETDLAMTELFGGFSPRFHAAYNEALPLETGYNTRKNFYNLYHVLNHLNLFGGGYQSQAERMIERLLSDIR